jgi:acyl-CoA thioesterase-1
MGEASGMTSDISRLTRRAVVVAALAATAAPWLPARAAGATRIVALGDSLTAGYGLKTRDAFPARLQAALNAHGVAAEVINAGVSGDTTAGGLRRLDWVLAERPDAVIVELGANDGRRGIDPRTTYANLDAILARLGAERVTVLLTGMYAPPNLGKDYGALFNGVFPTLAKRHGVDFYPFFLDGVALRPSLNQPDGVHPNAKGVAVIVERMLPYVKRLVARAGGS